MQYPPLSQFGQTNLAKLHLSPYYLLAVDPVSSKQTPTIGHEWVLKITDNWTDIADIIAALHCDVMTMAYIKKCGSEYKKGL